MDGWNDPSRGRMPAGARDNLLPRQCLVHSGVVDVCCNRIPSLRPVDNPTGAQMRHVMAGGLSAPAVLD